MNAISQPAQRLTTRPSAARLGLAVFAAAAVLADVVALVLQTH